MKVIIMKIPSSGTAKKIWFSQAMITSGPMQLRYPLPPSYATTTNDNNIHTHTSMQAHIQYSTNIHMHAHNHAHLLARICCGEERCDLNSAFQHSTSDYLFSFTGRFKLVMYFPFRVGTTLHLSLSLSLIRFGNSLFPDVWDPLLTKIPKKHQKKSLASMNRYCAV